MGLTWGGEKPHNESLVPPQYYYSFFTDSSREPRAEEATELVSEQLPYECSKDQTVSINTKLMKAWELSVRVKNWGSGLHRRWPAGSTQDWQTAQASEA